MSPRADASDAKHQLSVIEASTTKGPMSVDIAAFADQLGYRIPVTEGEFVLLAKCKQGIDRLIGVCLRLALHPGSHRFQCPCDDLFRRMEAAGVELFFDEAFGAGIEVEDHLL